MKYDILISQYDEHNEGNILISKKFNIKKVIYIYSNSESNNIKSLNDYYSTYIPSIDFCKTPINEGDVKSFTNIIEEYKSKNVIISITGGKRINSLMVLKVALDNEIPCVYIDIMKKIIYYFNDSITSSKEELEDLEIEDIVEAFGGNLVDDSCKLCDKEDIKTITKLIYTHLPIWHKYKQRLYDNNLFIHDYTNPSKVTINLDNLETTEEDFLFNCLNRLKDLNGIEYKKIDNIINVTFLNDYLKGFIFKSGTWLEVATNLLINEIRDIDEVKNGVMFLWNKNNRIIRNEVDIVAIKDSILICISCKDSNKYNENALNELNVYSEKLGGKNVCKILVATKVPEKLAVSERAKEMGINLVIFDGDENKFKNTIRAIINEIGTK